MEADLELVGTLAAAILAVLVSLIALRALTQRDEAERALHGSWAPDERIVDPEDGNVRYFKKRSLLTPNELDAFRYLRSALPPSVIICPLVRIADIVGVKWRRGQKAAFGRISQKHIDFLIIDHSGALLFAIEVDDSSHQRPDRKERDAFVDAVFKSVDLPLIRTLPRRLDTNDDLRRAIARIRQ